MKIMEIIPQIIGGLTAGAIGFLSALGMERYKDWKEVRNKKREGLIQLYNEVSENRLSLELELQYKRLRAVRSRLSTEIWQKNKYSVNISTPKLLSGLKILYAYVEQYNFICQFMEHLIIWRKMTTEQLDTDKVTEPTKKLLNKLLTDSKLFEKFLLQEMIIQKIAKPSEWKYKDSSWKDSIVIPYFINPKEKSKK